MATAATGIRSATEIDTARRFTLAGLFHESKYSALSRAIKSPDNFISIENG